MSTVSPSPSRSRRAISNHRDGRRPHDRRPYAGQPDIKHLRETLAELPRRHLLLRAVIADMEHLADPDLPDDDNLNAALELAEYDRRNCTWAYGPGPDSNTWKGDDGALEYVRAQWLAAQQNTRR